MKVVEHNAKTSIVDNKVIPDQLNNAAIKEVTNQIYNSLQLQVNKGKMDEVIAIFFNQGKTQSPIVNSVAEAVTSSLSAKFNITPDNARTVANQIVPAVINEMIEKARNPRDIDFDVQQIMRRLTGNNTLDISEKIPKEATKRFGNLGEIVGKFFGK
jgi:hypothetical protein